ncbi:hypothetical protein OAK75_08415, partial [Bacteriovoracales bacterium]|nr:hypothetical protein [Bacteriovoracales bacterium]
MGKFIGAGGSISDSRPVLVLICGDKESSISLRSLNAQLRGLSLQSMDSRFLSRETFLTVDDLTLDETLAQYANESGKYQEIVLVLLQGTIGEGLMGAGELFDKGALCLIEAESDQERSSFAHTFLSTGKAHLELGIPEMGEFIELFLKHPEEVKTFFTPRNQIVWGALSAQLEERGLDIKAFKHSFIFEGVLKRVHSRMIEGVKGIVQHFKDYVLSLEE